MNYTLKIWPQYYCRVADGSKTFEVRKNDRVFQCGDLVTLLYFDPEFEFPNPAFSLAEVREMWENQYKPLTFEIGYVLPIDAERVVFSLLPIEKLDGV